MLCVSLQHSEEADSKQKALQIAMWIINKVQLLEWKVKLLKEGNRRKREEKEEVVETKWNIHWFPPPEKKRILWIVINSFTVYRRLLYELLPWERVFFSSQLRVVMRKIDRWLSLVVVCQWQVCRRRECISIHQDV